MAADAPASAIDVRADGTVVSYYRGQYVLTKPADAEFIRIRRPDGSVVILVSDGEPYPEDLQT